MEKCGNPEMWQSQQRLVLITILLFFQPPSRSLKLTQSQSGIQQQ